MAAELPRGIPSKLPERTVRTQRRSTGFFLVGTANSLDTLGVRQLEKLLEEKRQFLAPKEQAAVQKLADHIGQVEETLNKLALRLGYDGT